MGMSGQSRSGRRTVLSEINVTPLVDVMLVLLIIFMVATPMMKQGLDVDLPETANSGIATPEDPFILVIKKNGKIYIGKTNLSIDNLRTKLKAIFKVRKDKQIYIQADRKIEYGLVAEVMGEVRAAGIFKIGLVTQPKVN